MKLLAVLSLVVLPLVTPASINNEVTSDVEILSYENNNDGLGTYKFEYRQSDGQEHTQEGELKNNGKEGAYVIVKGSYTWFAPDGTEYVVTYVADENGFKNEIVKTAPGPGSIPPHVLPILLGG